MVALLVWASGAYESVPATISGTVTPSGAAVIDRDIPITRFGDVAFDILWPDGADASMPDWMFDSFSTTRHIPGSNRNITQTLGKGPQTITYRLELASRTDLLNLKERVLETDTLVLFAAMTSAPDVYRDSQGEGYVFIADVLLLSLGQPVIFVDGIVEVDVTFQRPSS